MSEFIYAHGLAGVVIGLATFLIIGLFHPLVIYGEYYFGQSCKWAFHLGGLVCLVACLLVQDIIVSSLLGVTAFSCFWSIKEVSEQRERVRKGWFPENPRRAGRGIKTDAE